MTELVVVASRTVPLTMSIVTFLATRFTTDDVRVWTRASYKAMVTSRVERAAQSLAFYLGAKSGTFTPGRGRAAIYVRDYWMVEKADRVYAFFDEGKEMEGGTGHVVHAAIQKGVPVEAYAVDKDGNLILVGSDDGDPYRMTPAKETELQRLYKEMLANDS